MSFEIGENLIRVLVAKRNQRRALRHRSRMRKIKPCGYEEEGDNVRDRDLLGPLKIYCDRAQKYLLWRIEKCQCRAIE
jgi:hypothetical protein